MRNGMRRELSRDAVLPFFPPRAPVLIQGVSMLAGHKAPLYALDPPARVSPSTSRSLSILCFGGPTLLEPQGVRYARVEVTGVA